MRHIWKASGLCSAVPGAVELPECSWKLGLGDIQGGLSHASAGNEPREHPQSHRQVTGTGTVGWGVVMQWLLWGFGKLLLVSGPCSQASFISGQQL